MSDDPDCLSQICQGCKDDIAKTEADLAAALLQIDELTKERRCILEVMGAAGQRQEQTDRLVEAARKILSGGYWQGENGLLINRNQAEEWLKGQPTEKRVDPAPKVDPEHCDHGVTFDKNAAAGLTSQEVRQRWPRLDGLCPKGCGYCGIAYASSIHYYSGDW